MSEEKEKIDARDVPQTAPQAEKITTAAEAKKLFSEDFATSLTPVYVSSLGKDFSFREITVM